jgi:hypothetical protein
MEIMHAFDKVNKDLDESELQELVIRGVLVHNVSMIFLYYNYMQITMTNEP